MKVVAVIPVRAGSKRLPNKNILPFDGSNLLVHKIRQLKQVKEIDEIVVSTDSLEMIEMAKLENVSFQHRPYEYCDEKSKTFNEVVEYIASTIRADILIWAPCVCPIVSPNMYRRAIAEFLNLDKEYDSIASAMLLKEYVFAENKPVNFSIEHHVPSQKLPNWYLIKNGFFIANRTDMQKWKFVYGKNPKLLEISKLEAIDIDDEIDFELAKIVQEKLKKYEDN